MLAIGWKGLRWWEMSPFDGRGLGLKLTFTNKSSLVNIVTTAGEDMEDPQGSASANQRPSCVRSDQSEAGG